MLDPKCPKCGKELILLVSVRIQLPGKYALHLSKKAIAKRSCSLVSADWEKATLTCTKCWYREKGI